MGKNVILYCRVSSDEQAHGTSLPYQEERLRDYCNRNQHNIIECYKEDYSAKTFKDRPEIQKIMTYCRSHSKKVDEILFLRWDRYSRSLEFALTNIRQLRKLNITVNSIENPLDPNAPDFPTMFGVYVGNAEAENNKISKRTKDGIISSLKQGKCTNKAPYGYKNVRIDDNHKCVEIDRDKAKIIQQIFNQVANGVETPSYIWRKFKRKGFDRQESAFFDMLRNHFYIGEVYVPEYYNDAAHFVKGLHDAIIDKETFYKVQDILDGKKKKNPKLSKCINPDLFLRKYIVCPVCGHAITGATSRGNGGQYTYYNCSNDAKHFRYRANEANELFAKYMAGLKPNETVLELYNEILCDLKKEKSGEVKQDVCKLEKELQEIETNLNKADDKFIRDEIDNSTHNRLIERYTKDKNALQGKIDLIKNPNRSNIEPKLRYSISLINNIDNYMRNAKVEVKCKLLGSMFPEKITFDGKSYRTNSYNSVLDLIYKQTNELRGEKIKNGESFNTFSASVPRAGIEPACHC